ncbi:MAG: PDZ domain-containing protein, partial [Candidatus Angelobacter sp.]
VTVTVRRKNFPTVITVFSGTNAIAAGIRPGDKIMAVNNVSMYGVSHQDVWNHLTGKPGSQVHLSLARGDSQYETDVIRTDIMHIAASPTRQLFMSQFRMMGKSPLSEP